MGNPVLIKTLLTSVAVLTGVVAGLLAVILAKTDGAHNAVAIQRGAVAFGGTVTLTILIMTALGAL